MVFERMSKQSVIRTDKLSSLIGKIAEAGLVGDRQRLELLCLNAVRSLKKEFPDLADHLSSIIGETASSGSALRFQLSEPPPADLDAGLALVRSEPTDGALQPILDSTTTSSLERFLGQREKADILIRAGITPPKSLLLKGLPGTGKTTLAKWIAHQANLPLVVLDLASSISSFLGKTGGNLKRSLDYARANPCVLLLDEFDAIGKRRDDLTELGELKRIVNVLLKELEYWPIHSILIAATNHPELLDPAINRRFDVVLTVPMPAATEREIIFRNAVGEIGSNLPEGFLKTISGVCDGVSGSDIIRLAEYAMRRHIIDDVPLTQCLIEALPSGSGDVTKVDGDVLKLLQSQSNLTVRDLAKIFGRSASTIQYHLKK